MAFPLRPTTPGEGSGAAAERARNAVRPGTEPMQVRLTRDRALTCGLRRQ
ncbi:hypothetical protein SSAG_00921 [Streptomyces sp. Mg1]|nr:hypothetical protein SSAG_00921 [Streptomyces sp. Mg1]